MEHPLLDKAKLLQILQHVEKTQDVKVLSLVVSPGTETGENYSGELVKVDMVARVAGRNSEYHWMVKMEPEKPSLVSGMKAEEKEIKFYSQVLPAWKKMIKERGADVTLNCVDSPYSEFHPEDGKRSVLVMENLQTLGYSDYSLKKKGLSLAHAKCALAELGKFHALGYAHLRNYPGGLEGGLRENKVSVTDFAFGEPSEQTKKTMDNLLASELPNMLRAAEVVQEPGQDFVAIIKNTLAERDFFEERKIMFKPNPDQFNTICHGDAWFNNMLFKHDGEIPLHASLLDISITRYASPCTDLAYFLYTSTTPMLRETHLEDMLGHYHDTFVHCLHQLGEDPTVYSYRQLLKDFNKYSMVGFFTVFMMLPLVICKKDDTMGQDLFQGDLTDPDKAKQVMERMSNQAKEAMAKEPQVKVMLGGTLLDMVRRGNLKM